MRQHPYREEVYSPHILYVKSNDKNLEDLDNIKSLKGFQIYGISKSYIEVDIEKLTWRTCFEYEFLYRNIPPINTVEDIKAVLRKNKIENILE